MNEVSQSSYWSSLYQANDTGWDKGVCAPPIARLLREGIAPAGGRLAVIGCGRGHEAIEAAGLGYLVTAVDFAPEALAAVRQNALVRGVSLETAQVDVFELAQHFPESFDVIIEHTCLCAIDPARRDEYVTAVAGALRSGGILMGLYYKPEGREPPPYTIDEPEIRKRFETHFSFDRLCVATDSFENRLGNEFEFVARRR